MKKLRELIVGAGIAIALSINGCVSREVNDFSRVHYDQNFQKMQSQIYSEGISERSIDPREFYGCSEEDAREFVNTQKRVYELCKRINDKIEPQNVVSFYARIDSETKCPFELHDAIRKLADIEAHLSEKRNEAFFQEIKRKSLHSN